MLRVVSVLVTMAFLSLLVEPVNPAFAQDKYPSKPVQIIVPSAPGGGTDTVARLLAQQLSETLGNRFFVENRPGAGSMTGTEAAAHAPPDGYSILVAASTLTSLHVLHKSMRYDAVKDFDPVTMVVALPNVLVVNPAFPVDTLQGLITLAKKQPGTVSYATPGLASNSHMSMELLSSKTGMKLLHVPYNGVTPALTDVVAGRVPVMLVNLASAKGFIDSGALRAIAVSTTKRSTALPDVPTIAESGVAGFDTYQWFGVLTPAGTAPEIVSKLNAAILDAIRTSTIQRWIAAEAGFAIGNSPAEFRAQIADDVRRWSDVAKTAGIVPD